MLAGAPSPWTGCFGVAVSTGGDLARAFTVLVLVADGTVPVDETAAS